MRSDYDHRIWKAMGREDVFRSWVGEGTAEN